MKRLILLAALLTCVGCTQTYEIKLVNPQGDVHETHTIEQWPRPRVEKHFGGQTSIAGSKHINAPTGWYLDIDEVK